MGNRRSCCLRQKYGYGRDHNLWSIILLQAWTRHKILYYHERRKRNGLKRLTPQFPTWVGVVHQMNKWTKSVADPDLQISGGGGGGGGTVIQTLRDSVWSKTRESPGPLGPFPGSTTANETLEPTFLKLPSRIIHFQNGAACPHFFIFRHTFIIEM